MADEGRDQLEAWAATQAPARADISIPIPATPAPSPAVRATFSPALAGAREVVGLVRRLADAQGRDDLVDQLDDIRLHLRVEPVPVVLLGGGGRDTSSVLNALVGAPVCPVGTARRTVTAVAVAHDDTYTGELVIDASTTSRSEPARRAVGFAEASALTAADMNPGNRWALRQVELGVPSPALRRGLVLIDTPPVTEVWSPETLRSLRAVNGAAAVILVTSAAEELTTGELDLLRAAAALCHRVIVVVTGTDTIPRWSSVVERDQLLLEQRGVPARVFGVSTSPYWGEAGGVPPGPDAGMQSLAAYLEESVVLDTEHQHISKALVEAFWAADRLRMRLFAERSLIGEHARIDHATERLRAASRAAQELCSPTAAWRATLVDGLRDLQRDIAADLDHELARLVHETEQLVAGIGTTTTREEVHLRMHRRLADAIVHVHRVRKLAIRGLCKQVADRFQHDWSAIVSGLDMASEAHALLNPRLDRPALATHRSFATLALAAGIESATTASPIDPPVDPFDPRSQAYAHYRGWLLAVEDFLRADNADSLTRIAGELELRCQRRAIELHRSIVEVFTTLNLLRDLDPDMVLQRHEALASDLEQLRSLDFQLNQGTQQPKLGY